MEEFLDSLDMTNLKTMIENDSDYGDEVDMGVASVIDEKVISHQSATSMNCSQSAKSNNIKSPKTTSNNYKRPTFQI